MSTTVTVSNDKSADLTRKSLKKLVARLKVSARMLPKPTEALQIQQRSLKFLSFFGILMGADMRYDWKRNRRFVHILFLTALVLLQILYTQFLYIYQHDVVRFFEVFALYGVSISIILKINCYVKYFKNITALFNSTLKICQKYAGRDAKKIEKRLLNNFIFYKRFAALVLAVTVVYLYYPVKSYVIDGVLVPFVPIEIMFVDQSTISGYCIASGLMVVSGILGALGSMYMALTFAVLIMDYGPRVDIVEANFKELDEMWSDASISASSTSTFAYRHMYLRNICRQLIDMRMYIAEVKEIVDQKLFLFFSFAYLSQILCLYEIRVNDWIPGYALALGFFSEMIFYCVLGSKISVENERLCYMMTQSKWYTYDLRSQKLFLMLLNLALNSDELWIGPLKPLSVLTATEIIKSIYSYYTVMIEVM